MNLIIRGYLILAILGVSSAAWAVPLDSLGIEVIAGKTFVLHRVEAQETLYSLSKRYQSSIEAIKDQNQIDGTGLALGVILKIPYNKALTHQVQAGETLYMLSKRYQVSVMDLRKWNKLTSDALEPQQILQIGTLAPIATLNTVKRGPTHVVTASETLYSIANTYEITVKELQNWNNLVDFNVGIGDTLKLAKPLTTLVQEPQETLPAVDSRQPTDRPTLVSEPKPIQTPEASKGPVKAIKEKGIAAVFAEDDTKKYLALHRSAPVGTIMQVRNEMTNLSVFVRIVGKLPDTGVNNQVLIRLSKSAQQGLGALDNRFRVELSYIPSR